MAITLATNVKNSISKDGQGEHMVITARRASPRADHHLSAGANPWLRAARRR
jgi:hypothetical protein